MLRWLGAGLILCAALLTRRTLLAEARAAQRTRRALAAAFEEMEAEIRLLLTPLPALLRRGRGTAADVFLQRASRALSSGATLAEAWRDAAEALPLPEDERAALALLGGRLTGDETGVRAALSLAASRLRARYDEQERRRGQDERLVTALCVSAALLLAILFF